MSNNFSEESIKILTEWLRIAERELYNIDKEAFEHIGKAIGAIHRIPLLKKLENIPKSDHYQVSEQWTNLVLDDLFAFNKMGAEYICSITEATIKVNGLKKKFSANDNYPMFFRGEHIFGWSLISRLGRKHKIDWDNVDSHKVTPLELELLQKFQENVKSDTELQSKIFGDSPIIPDNDVGWWSIMQHYDDENGTRMIDITSSLYSALYFACADWDGSVNCCKDGKLYMFPFPPGRPETYTPDMFKDQVVGPEDKIQTTVETYFNIESSPKAPRFRVSPVMNNRALSQDGFFIWQKDFDKPFRLDNLGGNIFVFRIHREYKESILKELEAIGYTRDRILAENRFNRDLGL